MKKLLTIALMLVLTFAVFATVKTKYEVKKDDCIGCKLCIKDCPVDAIKMVDGKAVIDKDKCIGCGICVNKCPINAIVKSKAKSEAVDLKKITEDKATVTTHKSKEFTTDKLLEAKKIKPKVKTFNEETEKQKKRSEKYKAVKDAHKPQHTPCGTHPCQNAPEADKAEAKVANPKDKIVYSVNAKECIGCKICVKKCPVGAIEMKKGKAVIDQEKCIDCGICEKACPVKVIEKKENK